MQAIHLQELRDRVETAWSNGSSPQINWLVADQLGTPRMIFDQTGSLANVSRHDYLPFGEELFAGIGGRTPQQGYTASDNIRQKFTRKERDNETGLDYFLARYYSSTQGRFTSTDPLLSSAKRTLPQSWNRYGYTYNNPLRFVDPNGEDVKVLDEEALKLIRQTLPKNIRDKVKLNKNGLIDKKSFNKIKSDDQNLKDLKTMVNSSKTVEVGTASEVKGVAQFEYKSVEAMREETTEALVKGGFPTEKATEAAMAINMPTSLLGYTMAPEETDTRNMRVLLSDGTGAAATAPLEERVVTAGHELYLHAARYAGGQAWLHDDGGPVDAQRKQIEDRTRNNFRGQHTTPSNQQPKKTPQ